jgi:flagellar basal-body rod modification protein FlgD
MTSVTSVNTALGASPSSSATPTTAAEMQDRFLKLLVAQINSQDPLNPMDNAQMTSQMAQINTVGGIQQLNETLEGITSQFGAMQMLQASSLVGRNILRPGTDLVRDSVTGLVGSAFDLGGTASAVKIEILSPTGNVLGTVNTGSLPQGRHAFSWDASAYAGMPNLNYRLTAVNGDKPVVTKPYSTDRVQAVGMTDGQLTLGLGSGKNVPYASVAAIL